MALRYPAAGCLSGAGGSDFAYSFDHYGPHTILLTGFVADVYGHHYPISMTNDIMVARTLDLDPGQPLWLFPISGRD